MMNRINRICTRSGVALLIFVSLLIPFTLNSFSQGDEELEDSLAFTPDQIKTDDQGHEMAELIKAANASSPAGQPERHDVVIRMRRPYVTDRN